MIIKGAIILIIESEKRKYISAIFFAQISDLLYKNVLFKCILSLCLAVVESGTVFKSNNS